MNNQEFNNQNEAQLAEKLNKRLESLDDSVDELDRARLRATRIRAVEAAQKTPKPWFINLWLPTTATAALVLGITAVMWPSIDSDGEQQQQIAAAVDLELLVDNTELEFLQELEFVAWLAEEPEA